MGSATRSVRVLLCAAAFGPALGSAALGVDSDGDGVPDAGDVCPNTPPGTRVDSQGRPAADFNHDCAVNGLDLGGFLQTLMAPVGGAASTTHTMVSPTPEPSGYFGISVSGVPDVDGDGLTDLLVGAKLENPVGSPNDCGRAHLYSGRTGALLRNFASPNQEADGRFGWGVGGIPDVDGDGRGDVVIGAPLEDPPGSPPNAGRAYVFSGATGALVSSLKSPNATQGGLFGFCVVGLADVNGDGRGDVAIGGWHETAAGNPSDTGRAYVFSGATGTLLRSLQSLNPTVGGAFGISIAAVPDLNGDGIMDIVVGAPGESPQDLLYAGRAYVFSGADGSLLRTLVSLNPEELGNFGNAVGGLPDVDGDGRGDLIVAGADTPSGGFDLVGRAFIISGSSGQFLRTLGSPHEQSFGGFANAVAGVADIDGDGFGDALVGASGESPGGSPGGAGRAYAFSGATGALLRELFSLNEDGGGTFGYAVAGLTDSSGDGRGDVLVSGLFENPPPNPIDSGVLYRFNLADSDADGVPNDQDECSGTPAGTPVDSHGRPSADFNGDCQVTPSDIPGFVNLLLTL